MVGLICGLLWWQRRLVRRFLRLCIRTGKAPTRFLEKLWRKVASKKVPHTAKRHQVVSQSAVEAHHTIAQAQVRQKASRVLASSLLSKPEPPMAKKTIPIKVVAPPKPSEPDTSRKKDPIGRTKVTRVKAKTPKPIKTKTTESKKSAKATKKVKSTSAATGKPLKATTSSSSKKRKKTAANR